MSITTIKVEAPTVELARLELQGKIAPGIVVIRENVWGPRSTYTIGYGENEDEAVLNATKTLPKNAIIEGQDITSASREVRSVTGFDKYHARGTIDQSSQRIVKISSPWGRWLLGLFAKVKTFDVHLFRLASATIRYHHPIELTVHVGSIHDKHAYSIPELSFSELQSLIDNCQPENLMLLINSITEQYESAKNGSHFHSAFKLAGALIRLGDLSPLDYLLYGLRTRDGTVATEVLHSLLPMVGTLIFDNLIEILDINLSNTPTHAAYLLGEIGDLRALDPLVRCEKKWAHDSTGSACGRAIIKLGDPYMLKKIIDIYRTPSFAQAPHHGNHPAIPAYEIAYLKLHSALALPLLIDAISKAGRYLRQLVPLLEDMMAEHVGSMSAEDLRLLDSMEDPLEPTAFEWKGTDEYGAFAPIAHQPFCCDGIRTLAATELRRRGL